MPKKRSVNIAKKRSVASRKTPSTRQASTSKSTGSIAIATSPTPSQRLHIGMQLLIAGSAALVLVLLSAVEKNVFSTRGSNAQVVPVTIGLEHDSPLSVSLLIARKESAGYASIENTSGSDIHINVPSDWSRTEVTGTDLRNVTPELPTFGFTRYPLPRGVGLKFTMLRAPEAVYFDSPGGAVAGVDIQTIDLTSSKVGGRVVLVKEKLLVPLWIDGE